MVTLVIGNNFDMTALLNAVKIIYLMTNEMFGVKNSVGRVEMNVNTALTMHEVGLSLWEGGGDTGRYISR